MPRSIHMSAGMWSKRQKLPCQAFSLGEILWVDAHQFGAEFRTLFMALKTDRKRKWILQVRTNWDAQVNDS
nr:hypothetical protein [Ammoniphilus sp. YIM 78166]